MTVRELIDVLKIHPPNATVVISRGNGIVEVEGTRAGIIIGMRASAGRRRFVGCGDDFPREARSPRRIAVILEG